MANMVPARFKRVAEAFDEAALTIKSRPPCGSSGSEHSAAAAESLTDVDFSGLVNSFMWEGRVEWADDGGRDDEDRTEDENYCDDVVEAKDALERLLRYEDGENGVRQRRLFEDVEMARRQESGDLSSPEFKRRLMARLRGQGWDAGLCKTRWEKKEGCPNKGDYEYIDVNMNGERFIIEVDLRRELEIVRPTSGYCSLLELFPDVYAGKTEELKKIVRIMSNEIKRSMRKMGIHVPPWRRHSYMQAKWFSSYKRTTNGISAANHKEASFSTTSTSSRRVGFYPRPEISFKCREVFGMRNNGFRVGNLAAALSGG
ncbi:unnamed protein product [Cuscuta epithymum]|uniref:Uncharacterized protein n=1 Tax=Cuscuta epithymum TaxID=186058 RepID=A0AAV0EQP0_9ASTE|nr:unnamed protein product [Cuscuta epithymum]